MTLSTCFAHPGNCRSHSPAFVLVRNWSTAAVIDREPLWIPLASQTPDIHSNVISRRRLADIKRRPQARHKEDYIIHCGRDWSRLRSRILYHAPRNLNACLSSLVGIIVPGERVPANSGNVVAFRDGVAVAPDEQELGRANVLPMPMAR
jgi:hypothetical protein